MVLDYYTSLVEGLLLGVFELEDEELETTYSYEGLVRNASSLRELADILLHEMGYREQDYANATVIVDCELVDRYAIVVVYLSHEIGDRAYITERGYVPYGYAHYDFMVYPDKQINGLCSCLACNRVRLMGHNLGHLPQGTNFGKATQIAYGTDMMNRLTVDHIACTDEESVRLFDEANDFIEDTYCTHISIDDVDDTDSDEDDFEDYEDTELEEYAPPLLTAVSYRSKTVDTLITPTVHYSEIAKTDDGNSNNTATTPNNHVDNTLIAMFSDIDKVIELGNVLRNKDTTTTRLFVMKKKYYLVIPNEAPKEKENMSSILAEHGVPLSRRTVAYLEDYGTLILDESVFEKLSNYF